MNNDVNDRLRMIFIIIHTSIVHVVQDILPLHMCYCCDLLYGII